MSSGAALAGTKRSRPGAGRGAADDSDDDDDFAHLMGPDKSTVMDEDGNLVRQPARSQPHASAAAGGGAAAAAGAGSGLTAEQQAEVEAALLRGDELEVEEMSPARSRSLAQSLRRAARRNETARGKHPDDPEKFFDTELALHDEVKAVHQLTCEPGMWGPFLAAEGLEALRDLAAAHENSDIFAGAMRVMGEFTDDDALEDAAEGDVKAVLDTLTASDFLRAVVGRLPTLEASGAEEDAAAVHAALGLLENLIEARGAPAAEALACEAGLLRWLLERSLAEGEDDNKAYAIELLPFLLQASPAVREALVSIPPDGRDGVRLLLQGVHRLVMLKVKTAQQKEMVSNAFDAVCAASHLPSARQGMLQQEVFGLLVRAMEGKGYAAHCAIKACASLVAESQQACEALVEAGVLKHVGRALMGGKHKQHTRKVADAEAAEEEEEHVLTILSWLTKTLPRTGGAAWLRCLRKLLEKSAQKADALTDLLVRCMGAARRARRADEDLGISPEAFRAQLAASAWGRLAASDARLRAHLLARAGAASVDLEAVALHIERLAGEVGVADGKGADEARQLRSLAKQVRQGFQEQ